MGTWIWFYLNLLTVKDWLQIINLSKDLSKNEVKSCCLQLNFPNPLQDESWVHPAQLNSISIRCPVLHSWTSAAFLHASAPDTSCDFRYSESSCFKGTGGLSESSDSTQKKINPPWRRLPNFWWERTGKWRGKKLIFVHFSRSKPRLSHWMCKRQEVGIFAPG